MTVIIKSTQDMFDRYEVTERHAIWSEEADNLLSVEIFKLTHDYKIPTDKDTDVKWVLSFLEATNNPQYMEQLKKRHDWGALILTAKRMVFKYADDILSELNLVK